MVFVDWRNQVFRRDNYQCINCEMIGYIEAHHIKSWANYPDLRFEVDNGMTLCKKCHNEANKIQREIEKEAFEYAATGDPALW